MEERRGRDAQGGRNEVRSQPVGQDLLPLSQKIDQANPGSMEGIFGSEDQKIRLDSGGNSPAVETIETIS